MIWCEKWVRKLFGSNPQKSPENVVEYGRLRMFITSKKTILGLLKSKGYLIGLLGVLDLSPTFFSSMYNLRLLNLGDYYGKWQVNLPEGLEYLPNTLTCLVYYYWPLKSLPSNFVPHNLVVLKMTSSKLKKLWNGVHDLRNLRYINLSWSKNLSELPDLSQASNLEYVNLCCCTSLRRVPSCLRFRVCGRKCQSWQCWTIGYLDLSNCSVLEIFPEISGSVKKLICDSSPIAHLPSSICYLNCLEYLSLRECRFLKNLPELPRSIVELRLIKLLDIKELPYLFEGLSCLEELNLSDCRELLRLPSNIWKLKSLRSINLSFCLKLQSLPEIYLFEGLSCLEKLNLSGCIELLRLPSNIWKLKSLRSINLSFCLKLQSLPEIYLFEGLSCLEKLNLSRCRELLRLPSNIWKLKSLRSINLSLCCKLQSFPEILEPMESLEILDITFSLIRELPTSIEHLVGLKSLKMEVCKYLETLPRSMSMLSRLQDINLDSCFNLKRLPPLPVSLKSLNLSNCRYLEYLPENINQLHNLTTLRIRNCVRLEYLPELPLSLQYLQASGLGTISCSRPLLAQAWGNNDYSLEPREFLFNDCFKLDRDMCNIIVTEFQMRSLFAAAIYASKRNDPEGTTGYRGVNVGFPGNKIPEWFNVQFEGPSLHFTFPSHCHDINFLGVAVCAVVKGFAPIDWSCEISVKSNQDVSVFISSPFAPQLNRDCYSGGLTFLRKEKENMLMWYVHGDCLSWLDVAELGIKFDGKGKGVVKSCGIRFLQLQDIEELGIAKDQHAPGNLNVNIDDRKLKKSRNY